MAVQYCNYDIKGTLAVAGTSTFTGAATFSSSINMSDNEPINYGGQTMFTHTGSITRIGDNSSSSVLSISSGTATFAGNTSALVVVSRDNMFVDAGQLYIGAGNSSTDNTFRQVVNTGAGSFKLQKRISGTFTDVLGFDNLQNATFAGDITVSGGDITLGGTGRIQGIDTVSASTDAANKAYVDAHVSPAGTYLPLAGGRITGTAKIEFNNADQYIGASSTNDLEVVAGDDINYRSNFSRFFSGSAEHARLTGIGGTSWVVNGSASHNFGVGTTSPTAKLHVVGTGLFTGLVSGITPVAAANFVTKAYVDGGGGAGSGFLPLDGGTMSGNIVMGDNDITGIDQLTFTSGTYLTDMSSNYLKLRYASTGVGGIIIYDGDDTVQGYLYADGAATSSFGLLDGSGSFAVKCVEAAGVELFYSSDNTKKFETTNTGVTVTGALSITGDGSNAATLTESSIGIFTIAAVDDIILDAAGDIAFDAGGDDIRFRVNGTTYGSINDASSNLNIYSTIQDKDIKFIGNDGGTTITALTLDMSDAGSAIFNQSLYIPHYIYHIGNTSQDKFGFAGNDTFVISTNGTDKFTADANSAILLEAGITKLQTTSTGIEVSGSSSTFANLVTIGPGTTGSPYDASTFLHVKGATRSVVQQSSTNDAYYMFGDAAANNVAWLGYDHSSNQLSLHTSGTTQIDGNTTFTGDITVSGGDITLGGTGRIQGVDTVSSGTDAANKSYVDAQIATIPSGLNFQGNWNASTNSPTLASGTGTPGFYYNVSVAGSTNLDGETDWQVGDWAVFVEAGATDKWEKIDNTSALTGVGANNQVSLWGGTNTLEGSTALTFTGGDLYVTGDGNSNNWYSAYQDTITAFSDSGSSTITLTLTQRDGGTLTTSFSNPQGTVTGTGSVNVIPLWSGTGSLSTSYLQQSSSYANDIFMPQYIRHTGDTNTLIGFPAGDRVILHAGGNSNVELVSNGVTLRYNGSTKLETSSTGVSVTGGITTSASSSFAGNISVADDILITNAGGVIYMDGSGYIGAGDSFYVGGASTATDHTYIGDNNRNVTIYNGATLTVSGAATLSSVANASSDPNKFLCVNGSGVVQYRTGDQVLSDIGGAPATGGAYLPLAGGTMNSGATITMSGNLNLTYAYPRINLTDTTNDSDYSIINNDGAFSIYDVTNNSHRLSISPAGVATFAGDIKQSTRIVLQDNGTIQWGAAADYGDLTWDTGYALIYGQSGKGIKLGTNGSTLALELDTSQNATFAGDVFIPTNKALQGSTYPYTTNVGSGANATTTYIKAGSTAKTEIELSGGDTNSNIVFKTPTSGNVTTTALTIDGSQNATFAGRILNTYTGTSTHELINATSNGTVLQLKSTGDNRYLYFQTDHIYSNGSLYIGDNSYQTIFRGSSFSFENGNATFAGDITVSGGDITLSGTGRIQGVDTVSAGTDAANKDYVDTAVAGSGSGTVTGVSSATTSQLTVSQSSPAPALSIVTAAVANGGTALATGNQIYDWGVAAFAPIVSGGYLPLSGGTMTGTNGVIFPNNFPLKIGTSSGFEIYHTGSHTILDNLTGNVYYTQWQDNGDVYFQNDRGDGNVANFFYLDGGLTDSVNTLGATVFPDKSKIFMGNSYDLQIYHDGSNSYIQEGGTGELIISSGTVLRLRSDASPTGEEYINCTRDGAVALFFNNVEKFHTSNSGVDVLGDLTVDTTAVIDGAATINGQLNQNGDIKLGPSASIVLDDTPTGQTTSGSGTIVEWSVSVSTSAGNLYVVKSDGGWTTADADSEAKSTAMAAIALGGNATSGMLLQGFFYKASHGFAIGSPLYISNTAGAFSNTRPTGTGDYVRIIGYATSTNFIYFDPDKTWVKID